MKSKFFALALVLGVFAVTISSCSQCYECSYYVGIDTDNNGHNDDSTLATDDYYTANPSEITAKEDSGESCTAI